MGCFYKSANPHPPSLLVRELEFFIAGFLRSIILDWILYPLDMPGIVKQPQTLYDKVFDDHIVDEKDDGTILLYIGKESYFDYYKTEKFCLSLDQIGIWSTK
jgi:hypothetical protein